MFPQWVPAFAVGLGVGALLFLALRWVVRLLVAVDLPAPAIGPPTCASGNTEVLIPVDMTDPIPANARHVAYRSHVFDDLPTSTELNQPPAGAPSHAHTSTSVPHPLPSGLSGKDYAVVWAEYRVFVKSNVFEFDSCAGSGSGSGMSVAAGPPLTAAQAEQLEAVPRSFRLVPAGPHARLTETVLRYDSAASAPHDPLWCAASGTEPVVRWTLRLRRSAAGFTAVLQARYREAGRDVTLAWVADNWQFHTAGGFRPESAADALPGLVLSPA